MSVMYAEQKDAEFLRIMAIGTALIVALCIVLPNVFGVRGSAIALSAGEGVMTAMLLYRVRSFVPWRAGSTLLPMLAAGAGMACIILVLWNFPAALVIPTGCIVFALIVVLAGGLNRDDLRFLWGRFV
jgi:O-antigen/teichoic acid export membrane protein